ncbi:vacuolar fusion protein MON1 homolog A [Chrysoperla carnea]|uniref:vacuolar fusion protein MON1 homolog A n=1 Tax=Chrysoperla carnea TaxID=189513 RepID=UPI001D060DDE|nr:vacuolar fusion protein MON1 homolog A [Chrysoperla carnea]
MTSIDTNSKVNNDVSNSNDVDRDREPGASLETMLVTTDSYEEIETENFMSSSLDEQLLKAKLETGSGSISEIQEKFNDVKVDEQKEEDSSKLNNQVTPDGTIDDLNSSTVSSLEQSADLDIALIEDEEWLQKEKHVFILSSAGKPIYSRYGNEDKLVTIFGVMQALVSFIQIENDLIRSIHAGNMKYVFLVKGPLILVCVARSSDSVTQIILQLTYVFNQICSVLTLTQLNRIYEQRRNYDLRRLLSGAERLIDHLLTFMETEPDFMLSAVRCLPLNTSVRESIAQTISQACSKIKNLVFAILLARNELVTLVRMKKYIIHPADLHLIFNLVNSSESFKTAESWTPICLPKFDASGFLHGHVSYLAEDCQACLLLLTVDRDVFFSLSEAKQKIVDKLRRSNCLEPINESMNRKLGNFSVPGVPEVRHFLYKCKSTAQFYSPAVLPPYTIESEKKRLHTLYLGMNSKLHGVVRPLKLIYQQLEKESILGWLTTGFELYVIFEPLIDKPTAINAVNKILKWIKKEEDKIFIMNAPTF